VTLLLSGGPRGSNMLHEAVSFMVVCNAKYRSQQWDKQGNFQHSASSQNPNAQFNNIVLKNSVPTSKKTTAFRYKHLQADV
jgi:hypothetical protein